MVLITGGNSGIGLAYVREFARAGAQVVACGRDARRLAELKVTLPDVDVVSCDLTAPADIDLLVKGIANRHGRLDCLVLNAGVMEQPDFAAGEVDEAALRREIEINLIAPIILTHRLLPLLRRAGHGMIVVVTSGYALLPPRRAPTYAATKAGLRAFAIGLRHQLKPQGLRVVEVLPPLVDTPATAAIHKPKISAAKVAADTLAGLIAGRDEIAIGQVRLLPTLMRLAPGLARRIVAQT